MTTVTFTTVGEQFPSGTVAGFYSVKILGADGVAVEAQNVSGGSADFTLNPGTYTATVQLLDMAMNPLGAMVSSDAFTIAAPVVVEDTTVQTPSEPVATTITIMVPSVVTVV